MKQYFAERLPWLRFFLVPTYQKYLLFSETLEYLTVWSKTVLSKLNRFDYDWIKLLYNNSSAIQVDFNVKKFEVSSLYLEEFETCSSLRALSKGMAISGTSVQAVRN